MFLSLDRCGPLQRSSVYDLPGLPNSAAPAGPPKAYGELVRHPSADSPMDSGGDLARFGDGHHCQVQFSYVVPGCEDALARRLSR